MIYSQDRFSPLYLSRQSEKFDTEKFESIRFKDSENRGAKALDDGTRIVMEKWENECIIQIMPPNEYFFINKIFYGNGNIKFKGLSFIYDAFPKGTWYFYDELGNFKDTKDYDNDFLYTFEKMLELAKREGVIFHKYPQNEETDYPLYRPKLYKKYDEKSGEPYWELWKRSGHPMELDTPYKIEIIKIEGNSGRIISRNIMDAKVLNADIE